MRKTIAILGLVLFAASPALAHAFLDHSLPPVGSSLPTAPTSVTIWFTQQLEPAFSTVEVTDQSGNRVDAADAQVDATDPSILRATLKPLPAGTYKVAWRVVSVDTHPTDGSFYFRVGG
jgi:copper resistance protein C